MYKTPAVYIDGLYLSNYALLLVVVLLLSLIILLLIGIPMVVKSIGD